MATSDQHRLLKSVAAGALGGLIASFAMNQFQSLLSSASSALSEHQESSQGKQQSEQEESKSGDDATVKTANAISQSVFHHSLTKEEKTWAGPAVHYSLGTSLGVVYGLLAETLPVARSGLGTAYGSAVWLFADEIGVPAFGLSPSPTESPLSTHVQALAAHLVFGFVTALTRQILVKD